MKISCVCGCDCTEFVAQHAIPGAARFTCPVCDVSVYAIDDSVAAKGEASFQNVDSDARTWAPLVQQRLST
jgi:hypothetical protein